MSRRRRDSEVSLCIKYLLFFFNVFFWLVGGLLTGVGLWARVALTKENKSLNMFSGWDLDPAFLLMVIGIIMFMLGFCGCIGALRENICLLKFFALCLSIIFFVQLATGILGFVFRNKIKHMVAEKLDNTIVQYRSSQGSSNLQDLIDYSQMTFQCCGLASYRDWQKNVYFNCSRSGMEACSVPFSCCKTDKLNTYCGYKTNDPSMPTAQRESKIYTRGCIDGISQWFNQHLEVVCGVAVGISLLQVVGITFASTLISDIRRQKAKWDHPASQMHEPLYPRDM